MTTLNIVFSGPPEQRHVAKPTPMTPLSAVLQEACSKMRPALEASQCQLIFNKKPVDLGLPVRLANIPSGSKLELIKSAVPAAPAARAAPARPVAQASSSQVAAAQAASAAAEQLAASTSGPVSAADPLGLGRPLQVFTHAALEEAGAAAAPTDKNAELPDEWFEFTPDDFARVRYQQNVRKKEAMVFRSRELRAAEEESRAKSYGPIPIRFHFPDGTILQAQFGALEEVVVLQEFVQRCVVSEARSAFYLYTTPPRQQLKDLEATLYRAQLVPAANVHVHVQEDKIKNGPLAGPLLRPEVLAQLQEHVPDLFPKPTAAEVAAEAAAEAAAAKSSSEQQAQQAGSGADAGAGAAMRTTASGQRVPKWMKL